MLTDDSIEVVKERLALLRRSPGPADVAEALRWSGEMVSDDNVRLIQDTVRRDSIGAGVLDRLLERPGVTDVVVNGPDAVYIDCGDGLELTDVRFDDDEDVRRLAVRLAASVGRRLDDGSPFVDARLADGTRVHAVLAPVSGPGTCVSLRIPSRQRFDLDTWVERGSMSASTARLLAGLVTARVPFLISGGTGSGKTTLLASMLAEVSAGERLIVVEDSRELSPAHPHVVRLEGRPSNAEGAGQVTLTDLVRQALRMRPDRIVLGEVRGAELCDLLRAFNTGHEGGCATVHANSASDVPTRLEALAALGGLGRDAAHAQIASALSVVIHVERDAVGRRVGEVSVFERRPDGLVVTRPALVISRAGETRGPGWERLAWLVRGAA